MKHQKQEENEETLPLSLSFSWHLSWRSSLVPASHETDCKRFSVWHSLEPVHFWNRPFFQSFQMNYLCITRGDGVGDGDGVWRSVVCLLPCRVTPAWRSQALEWGGLGEDLVTYPGKSWKNHEILSHTSNLVPNGGPPRPVSTQKVTGEEQRSLVSNLGIYEIFWEAQLLMLPALKKGSTLHENAKDRMWMSQGKLDIKRESTQHVFAWNQWITLEI